MTTSKVSEVNYSIFFQIKYTFAVGLSISVLSLIPGDRLPESDIQNVDILVHIVMYGTWLLILFAEKRRQFSDLKGRYYLKATILFVLFGGIMELLQQWLIPGRFGAWSDFIANSFGCLLGLTIIYLISKRNQKPI